MELALILNNSYIDGTLDSYNDGTLLNLEAISNTFANGRILLPLSCGSEPIANMNPLNWNIGSDTEHLKMFKNLSQLWNVIRLSGVKKTSRKNSKR